MSYYWCAECGEPCEAIEIDEGYGVTEYWGAVSSHEDWVEVSDCCEADLIDDEEERDNLFAVGHDVPPIDQQTNQGESK